MDFSKAYSSSDEYQREELKKKIERAMNNLTLEELEALHYDMKNNKDEEERTRYLSHKSSSNKKKMVKVDKKANKIAENLDIKGRAEEIKKENERNVTWRKIWKTIGYIIAMSVVLIIIWESGLLIPLGILGLIMTGIIKWR